MLEHNELTHDEQLHPELTKQLQENYAINQADQQSLQRIRTRIQRTRMASIPLNSYPENIHAGQFVHSSLPVSVQQRTHSRRWRIGVLAALLLIALLGGAFIALRFNPLPITGNPYKEKPKNTPVVPIKSHLSLFRINMKSATIGWGEGDDTNLSPPQRVIVRTIDGGKTWNDIQLPVPYTDYVISFFLDETTAWLIPGSGAGFDTDPTPLIRTTDGGKSWQKFMIPGGTSEITFVDKQNGWAMDVKQKGQGVTDQDLAIFHTKDGGKTWKLMSKAQAGATNITPGPFPSGEFGSGIFLNSQTGWFINGTMLVAGHGSAYKALYITQDGGKTWQLQQLPQSDEIIPGPDTDTGAQVVATISPPMFFDAQNGMLYVYVKDQQKEHVYVYSTHDGGHTWQLRGNKFSQASGPTISMHVVLIDATHFLLVAKNEADMYELVGGQWQKKYKVSLQGAKYYDSVDFVNGQTGWVVVAKDPVVNKKTQDKTYTSILYQTSDGGKSWQAIQQGSYVESASASQGG